MTPVVNRRGARTSSGNSPRIAWRSSRFVSRPERRSQRQRRFDCPPEKLSKSLAVVRAPLSGEGNPPSCPKQIGQIAPICREQLVPTPSVERHVCTEHPTPARQCADDGLIQRLVRLVAGGGSLHRTVEERYLPDVQPVHRCVPTLCDRGDVLVLARRVPRGITAR